MPVFTGQAGNVTFATGRVTNVYKWEINIASDLHDSTAFIAPALWRTFAAGLSGATGSYVCFADDTDAAILPGAAAPALAVFLLTGGRNIQGDILVSDFTIGSDVGGGLCELTVNFTFSGVVAVN